MRMKVLPLAVLSALLVGVLVGGGASAGAKAKNHKVDICHLRGDGSYKLITVARKAEPAHLRHDDAHPGDTVDGRELDENCNFVTQRFESPPLAFGPMGWGGWSCPAGTTAVGGGFEPSTATVAFSGLAAPGEPMYPNYPHHTFAPGETGFVVQNDNDTETITIFVLCE